MNDKPIRKQISTRTRFEIFKRDGFSCQYCGKTPPEAVLHVDHIIPVSKGGKNDRINMITSCSQCNFGKSSIPLFSVLKKQTLNLKEEREKEKQLLGYYELMKGIRERIEQEAWEVAALFQGVELAETENIEFLRSFKRFIERLGKYEVLDAMDIALSKFGLNNRYKTFKYFCGVCWKKIKDKEEV